MAVNRATATAVAKAKRAVLAQLPPQTFSKNTYVVSTVTAGAADGGTHAVATVDVDGTDLPVKYLHSYTPVVGHVVTVLVVDGAPLILGRAFGTPD